MVKFPHLIFLGFYCSLSAAYKNRLYTIAKIDDSRNREYKCLEYQSVTIQLPLARTNSENETFLNLNSTEASSDVYGTEKITDPFDQFQSYLHKFLYGENVEVDDTEKSDIFLSHKNTSDDLRNYVAGNFMRAELFNNKRGVHLPPLELLHRGHCELNITRDLMQTAVNAFAIFLYGTLSDIVRLPADYVIKSARTISMMKIAREKLAATWLVVRQGKPTRMISHNTLELYRPLFKYVTGREMARLNLSDERILTYIGTHADLDRHQVGVVASKYIKMNKYWSEPKYLNLMNNLLCGVPMTFMRKIPENTYLQLSHQVFYHIRACDPLQRRFYYAMMSKTQAFGKSYSWNARDVSRLGLLLAEVDGSDLSAINPEAMAGITAQVMMVMSPQNLQHLSELQLQYIGPKPLNILARKLKIYYDQLYLFNKYSFISVGIFIILVLFKTLGSNLELFTISMS
ncbi:uncharacterized protein LOC126774931 [Nymphalis io]|uniref:uncharacterized protein LOC126774931 n=1 Tax=Inachis io TaxID=171585 RepID=UPI00216983A8|nr:uncharacterized protein LOC126774931 [Nymphalis io]